MAGVMPLEGKEYELGQLTVGSALNGDWYIGLMTNVGTVFDINSVQADVTEATFSGYPGVQLAIFDSVIYTYAARDKARDGPALIYAHNGGGVGNTVTGWFLTVNTGTKLFYVEYFELPKVMNILGDVISLLPTIILGKLLP